MLGRLSGVPSHQLGRLWEWVLCLKLVGWDQCWCNTAAVNADVLGHVCVLHSKAASQAACEVDLLKDQPGVKSVYAACIDCTSPELQERA